MTDVGAVRTIVVSNSSSRVPFYGPGWWVGLVLMAALLMMRVFGRSEQTLQWQEMWLIFTLTAGLVVLLVSLERFQRRQVSRQLTRRLAENEFVCHLHVKSIECLRGLSERPLGRYGSRPVHLIVSIGSDESIVALQRVWWIRKIAMTPLVTGIGSVDLVSSQGLRRVRLEVDTCVLEAKVLFSAFAPQS